MTARSIAAIIGGGVACSMAAGWLEARAYRVVRHKVALRVGAERPSHLRILHISDVHYVRGQAAKARFIASLNELEPDLVVTTGDLLSDDEGFDEFFEALGGLLNLPGAFVFGSNDYFGPSRVNPFAYLTRVPGQTRPRDWTLNWRRVRDAMTEAGWHDLDNARSRLAVAGLSVELRGTKDAHIQLDDYAAGAAASDAAWADQAVDVVLGVTHAPYRRVLDAMAADGVPLILAGHTHGGQICLPWGAIVANCDLPPAVAKGLSLCPGGSLLHVTAGVGTSPAFPFRLFCRPEACVLDVTLA